MRCCLEVPSAELTKPSNYHSAKANFLFIAYKTAVEIHLIVFFKYCVGESV